MKRLNECGCGCGAMKGSCMGEGSEKPESYMFFGNLQTIKRAVDSLLEMDPQAVDEILNNGHDWAADHIASSKDDIQEVADFLINKMGKVSHHPSIMPFVKTFESYVNEVSGKRWREIETGLRGRGLDDFANRVSAHREKYGTDQVTEVKLVGLTLGYERSEVNLSVTDLEIKEKSGSEFRLVGNDSAWGVVVIYGTVYPGAGTVHLFESQRMPLLASDRKNAKDLIKFLADEGVINENQLDWRRFTKGYVSFKEAYKI